MKPLGHVETVTTITRKSDFPDQNANRAQNEPVTPTSSDTRGSETSTRRDFHTPTGTMYRTKDHGHNSFRASSNHSNILYDTNSTNFDDSTEPFESDPLVHKEIRNAYSPLR